MMDDVVGQSFSSCLSRFFDLLDYVLMMDMT